MKKITEKKKKKRQTPPKYDAFVMQFGFEYPHKTYQTKIKR